MGVTKLPGTRCIRWYILTANKFFLKIKFIRRGPMQLPPFLFLALVKMTLYLWGR